MASSDPTSPRLAGVDPYTSRRLPERIGHYRIVSRLGEGGMGVVFEAVQESPRRTVALKVLGTGVLSEEAERRFAREAEVLGRLQHPGIAQVFEAGSFPSEVGPQPFFAMELVRGEPLTRYADKNRLGTRERLELVARIADAVEHAHGRGVVHRDLKPANLLVEASGQPRILDFGVARATGSDVRNATLRTDMGQLLGTIPYMSPEQASGDPSLLDARSDVYALGVVLYELLAGRLPHELGGLMVHEAVRVVREEEARPLSSLDGALRGDVETIVAKALEKDPERRYLTAAALAADLRRFLANEPIRARPQSAIYRLTKFARRNRGLVAGLLGVFAALVLGLVGTSLGLLEARRQRDEARAAEERASAEEARASEQAVRADRTAGFLKRLLGGIDPNFAVGADTTLLRRILADTEARLESELGDLPLAQAEIENTIGMTYSAIGERATGLEHLRAALAVRERELGPEAPDTLQSRANVGGTLSLLGRFEEARQELQAVSAASHRTLGDEHVQTLNTDNLLATALFEAGRFAQAHEIARSTLAVQRRVQGDDAEQTLYTMVTVSSALLQLERTDEAQALLEELRERSTRVRGRDHPQTLKIMNNLAGLASQRGRLAQAIALQRDAYERSARVNGPSHPLTLELLAALGGWLAEVGQWDEAEALLRSALTESRERNGAEHRSTLRVQHVLGTLLRERGRLAEAIGLHEEELAALRRGLGEDVPATRRAMLGLAMDYTLAKRWIEAEALLREILAAPPAEIPARAAQPGAWVEAGEGQTLRDSLTTLAQIQLGQGRLAEAEATHRRALALSQEGPGAKDRGYANLQSGLALVLIQQRRFDEAEALLRSAIELQTRQLGLAHADTLTSCFNLGACLWSAGRGAEALPHLIQAASGWSELGGDAHSSSVATRELLLEVFESLDEPALEEPWRRRELARLRAERTPENPALGEPLAALARTLLAQEKLEEARTLLEEAVLVQAPLALEDWRVSWTNVLLAGVLAAQGEADLAAALWEGSEAGLRTAPGPIQRWARAIVPGPKPSSSGC